MKKIERIRLLKEVNEVLYQARLEAEKVSYNEFLKVRNPFGDHSNLVAAQDVAFWCSAKLMHEAEQKLSPIHKEVLRESRQIFCK